MSSGSYFPPPVRAVAIPKKTGGQRILGVPTVADRVAQMVVKQLIEPDLDPIFLADSYGYRPGKSALDAVGVTRERCWKYDWVLEFDIKGLFDNIDHELLLRAVRKHVTCKWALLYIERWLTAPMEQEDGMKVERTRGTPQGGVVSPILANLFLHYAFDLWMTRTHPDLPWCRYADDGLVHCRTEQEAEALKAELQAGWQSAAWRCIRQKPRSSTARTGTAKEVSERAIRLPRIRLSAAAGSKRQRQQAVLGLHPGGQSLGAEGHAGDDSGLEHPTSDRLAVADIARQINPLLRGWIEYYGRYAPSALYPLLRYVNQTLLAWVMRKFKRFKAHKIRAESLSSKTGSGKRGSLRALATRYDRHVCLMGAV